MKLTDFVDTFDGVVEACDVNPEPETHSGKVRTIEDVTCEINGEKFHFNEVKAGDVYGSSYEHNICFRDEAHRTLVSEGKLGLGMEPYVLDSFEDDSDYLILQFQIITERRSNRRLRQLFRALYETEAYWGIHFQGSEGTKCDGHELFNVLESATEMSFD